MVQYIRFRQAFVRDAPEPFVVPYCMATVIEVGGRRCPRVRLCFSYRQWAPRPLPTPIFAPTRSTCAPGKVLFSQPLPPDELSTGVVPDSARPLLWFPRKLASASKKDHGRTRAIPGSTTALSPPYPSTQVSESQTGRLVRGRTWTHVLWSGSLLEQARTKTPSAGPKQR
jgi:hypothetical protein